MKFEKYIDHTLLKPESTRTQIDQIIDEAKAYNFKSVCVNPTHVKYAAERLADSEVLVCTVIGFPLGASTTATKAFETEDAIQNGADFVKTSTGFAGGGATAEDVKLMKDTVGADVEVKASGGVRNLEDFNKMVEAGATRIGASAGVQIMQGLEADSDY
ncbi:2-deoxyribose-5-phosphate aldolase [Staphylococcus aureus]|uniref:2-deoxyribose-5-phosphate aldolase n=1 Tax=Staphylococcus aureus TaxID=1280 RepID=UPI001CC41F7A|nr:deoxyribose-phosphate aldolase [Staphylococcus aureus]MBZ5272050.1 2-deoxyribose-5-phosphate aldolase [Staphylococcus aureus]